MDAPSDEENDKATLIKEIKEAVEFINLVKQGEQKAKLAEDLLEEIKYL